MRYWLHNGFVNIDNEKMSKSLGNFFTIRDVLEKVHPEALRLFVISKHYRSPVDFTDETVAEAERGLERLYGTLGAVQERTPDPVDEHPSEKQLQSQDAELWHEIQGLPDAFREAMDNDFNTAQAIGHLFTLQRGLQRFLDRFGQKKLKGPAAALARMGATRLRDHGRILGLLEREPAVFMDEQRRLKLKVRGVQEAEVVRLIEERDAARRQRNFEEADRIRGELDRMGIQIEDSPQGTRWRVAL